MTLYIMRSTFTALLFFTFSYGVYAQEILMSTDNNIVLRNQKPPVIFCRAGALTLPFIDDFSYCQKNNYPNPQLWQSNQTFINSTYAVRPPTLGVATFDGLNEHGVPYDTSFANFNPRSADTLRSQAIDLSGYMASDSIYLSFYFQSQGLGDMPNNNDSLVLEFLHSNGSWSKQWGVNGQPYSEFKMVMIPIKTSDYFHDLFQFRFRNYASITGNNDHWNIDYVKLDVNRNSNDTLMNDIAIQQYSTGLLKNYSTMPWNQFKANANGEVAFSGKMFYRNNYGIAKNTTYSYKIEEVISSTVLGSQPLQSFNFNALTNDSSVVSTINPSSILSQSDALFKATYFCYATGSGDVLPANDTVVQFQHFNKYFAYDDGSAEKIYGVLGTGAKAALRFKANMPDTIQAIQVHFGRLQGNQTGLLFSFLIWKKLNPETIIYEQDFNKPIYVDSTNGFATYILDSGILVSDTFYIGWMQSQQDMIYVGFDRNTNSKQNLFYNIGAQWQNSMFDGSLMIRPMLGKREDFNVGILNQRSPNDITVFPNPANNYIYINSWNALSTAASYNIYTSNGILIKHGTLPQRSVNISELTAGLYFIEVRLAGGDNRFVKFIKE